MTSAAPRLLVGLPLLEGESIPSFVQRHCAANAVFKVGDLLRLVSVIAKRPIRRLNQLVCDEAALSALEQLTRSPARGLQSRMMWPIDGARGPLVRQGEHQWSEDARVSPHQAICPICLAEGGYGRVEWEFVQAPVCTVHGISLVERCHRCEAPLASLRTTPLHCEHCGTSLCEAARSEVSDSVLRAATLVQSATMAGFGHPSHTSPISPRDISDLLRLCVLPAWGVRMEYGLEEALHEIPLETRLESLGALGQALNGRTIDADALRPYLMKRWPHAPLLGRRQQRRLLAAACEQVGMLRDVASLVCDGRDDLESETAVRLLGPRLPRLYTRAAVADFLSIEERALVCLERAGLRLASPTLGYGYDMDEVLSFRHALDEAYSLGDVDTALGIAGLAEALVEAKVLHSIKVWREVLVHADSVTSLFSAVQRAMCTENPGVERVQLADWIARVGSTELATAAVIWAVKGSLPVVGWSAPYRLVDIAVDAGRLADLVSQRATSAPRSTGERSFVTLGSHSGDGPQPFVSRPQHLAE